MRESKSGRKRKRAFAGGAAVAAMDDQDQEDQENMETTENDLNENIEANETEVRIGDSAAESISGRVLVDVTNWQVERSPFGDMFVSPNGQMLSKEYAWDWVKNIMKTVSRRK